MGEAMGPGAAPPRASAASLRLRSTLGRLLGQLASGLVVVLVVATVVFFAFRLLPGDPTLVVLGEQASAAERAALRTRLHLDDPLLSQYLRFLAGLVRGQAGASLRTPSRDALAVVVESLPDTARLAGVSVGFGAFVGVAAGLASVASTRRFVRRLAERGIVLAASVPLLAFAPVVTWALAVRLRWVPLPADPEAGFRGLLFAGALLGLPLGAAVGRMTRATLLEARESPFLRVARAKGRSRAALWLVHALPTCAGPLVTVLAAQLGALLGGAVVLERLLERRGLGTVLVDALAARDLPVLQACVLVSATFFVVVQALGVQLHAAIDPRAR